jgi:hypothetical protein
MMCDANKKEFLKLKDKVDIVGISGLTLEEEFFFKTFQNWNKFQGEIDFDQSVSGEFDRNCYKAW